VRAAELSHVDGGNGQKEGKTAFSGGQGFPGKKSEALLGRSENIFRPMFSGGS
jgi:hypothetical protein